MDAMVKGLWKGLDGTVYGYCTCGREVNNKDNFRSDGSVKELKEENNGSAKEAIKKSRDECLKCLMGKATLIWPDFDAKSL